MPVTDDIKVNIDTSKVQKEISDLEKQLGLLSLTIQQLHEKGIEVELNIKLDGERFLKYAME